MANYYGKEVLKVLLNLGSLKVLSILLILSAANYYGKEVLKVLLNLVSLKVLSILPILLVLILLNGCVLNPAGLSHFPRPSWVPMEARLKRQIHYLRAGLRKRCASAFWTTYLAILSSEGLLRLSKGQVDKDQHNNQPHERGWA